MIGIDISDRSIKIAELVGKNSSQLRTVCWSPLSPNIIRRGVIQDVALATASLKQAFTKCSPVPLEGNVVIASIPETQSFVRVLELPAMPDSDVDEAVQWAVRQHIPFDLDRVYLDWQPVQEPHLEDKRRHILVGAVQKDVVDPLLQVLDGAGLRVAALELEAQAIVRSILPRQAFDVRGVLIVDLGATSTNIIFFDEGAMRFTASVQMGGDDLTQELAHVLNIQPGLAADKKALIGVLGQSDDITAASALHESAAQLVARVEKVVREMKAQSGEDRPLRAILLSGGSANLQGITNVFAEVFPGIPIQIGNPWTNIVGMEEKTALPLSAADASHFVTALGLALRDVEYA